MSNNFTGATGHAPLTADSAPLVYGQNFRAQELRQHGTPNRWRFMAADDTHASAVAAAMVGYLSSQQTSLVARIATLTGEPGSPRVTGSRVTCKVLLFDSTRAVWRINTRNVDAGAGPADIVALYLGAAYTSAFCTLAALSGPAALPSSGAAVNSGNATLVTLP